MVTKIGTAGPDNLVGTDGNNFLDAKGGDFLDGGDGIDTAHYESSARGASVNLFLAT